MGHRSVETGGAGGEHLIHLIRQAYRKWSEEPAESAEFSPILEQWGLLGIVHRVFSTRTQ